MSSFFNVGALSGNPFSSAVGQRIEQATDAALASENWALNMEICDMINESSDAARDAMKAIRKRISQNAGKNYTVIIYTLTVLETCVKNCGKAFHILVSNKEFVQELVKLIGPKNDPPAIVQEKVLSLIQIWADAFRNQVDLIGVVQIYTELKNKGIEFPATDVDSMAPIYTPQRSVPENTTCPTSTVPILSIQSHQQIGHLTSISASPAGPSLTVSTDQMTKLQSELDTVSMNMNIFGEMLFELKPGQEDSADLKLLSELATTCKEMQGRIVELIGRVTNDKITAELLRLNDELNNLFLRHQRYEKNREPSVNVIDQTPIAVLGVAIGVPLTIKPQEPDTLIDLTDEATGGVDSVSTQLSSLSGLTGTISTQLSKISTVTAQSGSIRRKDVDEFDMLAQSRKTNIDTNNVVFSNEGITDVTAIAKQYSDKDGEIKTTNLVVKTIDLNARESEFDEMAAWLGNANDEGPEESLTSKEFDRFLAERAAAADGLPNLNVTTVHTHRDKPVNKGEESLLSL